MMSLGNASLGLATQESLQGPYSSPANGTEKGKVFPPTCPIISRYQFELIPVLYCIIFIVGLVGNSLLIMALCHRRSPKTVSSIYIANLAVADFLTLTTVPFWASYYAYGYNWLLGSVMCKLSSSVLSLTMFASIFFIVCMNLNRYQALVYPFRSQQGTQQKAVAVALMVWVLAALISLPTLYFREARFVPELNVTACIMAYPAERYRHWSAGMALLKNTFGFLLPLAIIVTCYVIIRMHLMGAQGLGKSKQLRDRVLKLVAAVVVAFLICWLPFHILTFLDALSWLGVISNCRVMTVIDAALPFGIFLGLANSCINPLLYYFISSQFQDKLQHLVKLQLYQFSSKQEPFCSSKNSSLKTTQSLVEGDAEKLQAHPLAGPGATWENC